MRRSRSTAATGACWVSSLRSGSGCGQTGLNLSAVRIPSQRVTGLVGGRKRSSPPSREAYSSPRYASTCGSVGSGRSMSIPRSLPYRVLTTRRLICVEKTLASTTHMSSVSVSRTQHRTYVVVLVVVETVPMTGADLSALIQGMVAGRPAWLSRLSHRLCHRSPGDDACDVCFKLTADNLL